MYVSACYESGTVLGAEGHQSGGEHNKVPVHVLLINIVVKETNTPEREFQVLT